MNPKKETHFNYFHNHRWARSIQDKENLPQYHIYWQRMSEKMNLIFDLILGNVKKEKDFLNDIETEAKKYNNLFKEDVLMLIKNQFLEEGVKEYIASRIKENFHTVRCALLMNKIAKMYGKARISIIIDQIKDGFADMFYRKIKKYKNSGIQCMSADHEIKKSKKQDTIVLTFYNCPIYGVFKKLDLKDLNKEFCVLCKAHAKRSAQARAPLKIDIRLSKSLSGNDSYCEFVCFLKSPILRVLAKTLSFIMLQ